MSLRSARHLNRLPRAIALLCAAMLLMAASLGAMPPKARASAPLLLRYRIDRGAVPGWVTYRDLTLRFRVGNADVVRAWGDGKPLMVRHDRRWGNATITTAATEVVLALDGDNLDPSAVGAVQKATLRDDKLWAFSLTFDDGQFSVYQYAYPELRRYGYRAGVAVIGLWLDRDDSLSWGYCRADELLELLGAGWSVFNHSYSHYAAESDISFTDAMLCQQAIETKLDGYRATVFTAPHVSPLWQEVIDRNTDALGLYLLQLRSDSGETLLPVDGPFVLGQGAFHLGRADIKNWSRNGYNYFDQAHALAMTGAQQHVWLSLHGHSALYDQDWCGMSAALSYLYDHYGAGGSDEVWVAPADEIMHYLVTRTYASVSRVGEGGQEPEQVLQPEEWVTYRQGSGGYEGWTDTHIQVWYPSRNNGGEGQMVLWSSVGDRSSLLMRAELPPPVAGAQVVQATLSLYALSSSNNVGVDISLYPLLTPWKESEATWNRAMSDALWRAPGARGLGVDRQAYAEDWLHEGGCSSGPRWHLFDITASAQRWAQDPSKNFGIIIEGADEVSKGIYLASSEHPDKSLRPTLKVLWRMPSESGSLKGAIWEDSNGNALRDEGETALSGATVEMWNTDEHSQGRRQSDPRGEFAFENLAPGTYTIAQYPLPGYTLTTASTYTVTISSRTESRVAFGNRAVPTAQPVAPIYLPILLLDP